MNKQLSDELHEMYEKMINRRNKYCERKDYNKSLVSELDKEIELIERIRDYMFTADSFISRKIAEGKTKWFNAGRESGAIEAKTGRLLDYSFFS